MATKILPATEAEGEGAAAQAELFAPRQVTERFQLDRYQITGNHFQGMLNTWRNFADKKTPTTSIFIPKWTKRKPWMLS